MNTARIEIASAPAEGLTTRGLGAEGETLGKRLPLTYTKVFYRESNMEQKTLRLTQVGTVTHPAIDDVTMRGMVVRFDMLLTHYRQPKDFKVEVLNSSARTLRRWYAAMRLTTKPPPVEFIQALEDDLNTPKAITYLHQYARGRPEDLYAGLAMLGLIPGTAFKDPHELKTLPLAHIPLPQWEWASESVQQ
jgi:hypothetical protein